MDIYISLDDVANCLVLLTCLLHYVHVINTSFINTGVCTYAHVTDHLFSAVMCIMYFCVATFSTRGRVPWFLGCFPLPLDHRDMVYTDIIAVNCWWKFPEIYRCRSALGPCANSRCDLTASSKLNISKAKHMVPPGHRLLRATRELSLNSHACAIRRA